MQYYLILPNRFFFLNIRFPISLLCQVHIVLNRQTDLPDYTGIPEYTEQVRSRKVAPKAKFCISNTIFPLTSIIYNGRYGKQIRPRQSNVALNNAASLF
ncbi:hypothetical protein FKM82_013023 [Ascaphus truei]